MAEVSTPRAATPAEALVTITAIGATHLHRTLSLAATRDLGRARANYYYGQLQVVRELKDALG